jgi:hypothetical protein
MAGPLPAVVGLAVFLTGCVSYTPAPATYAPQSERVQTKSDGPIAASVAVLSRDEAETKFGLPLHKKGIQPVWVRLENRGKDWLVFLPTAIDADYFSAGEVAYMHGKTFASEANRRMEEVMRANEIPILLKPGKTIEGFVYTNYDPGAKHVRLQLLGEEVQHRIDFTLPVPDGRYDRERVELAGLYPGDATRDYRRDEVRAVLEQLPATTTNADAEGSGDPVNLVVIGTEETLTQMFARAGWDRTETLTAGNGFRLVGAFLFKKHWRTSPVSPLYVFGRPQDFALQKARRTIHERNHLRLWLAPFTCEGRPVWVGQISRDIGVRFTTQAPGFVTHKIDPEVDEARDYLAQDLVLSGGVSHVGWVGGVGAIPRDAPGRNLTGDPYYTDGNRVVLVASSTLVEPGEVHLLEGRSESFFRTVEGWAK